MEERIIHAIYLKQYLSGLIAFSETKEFFAITKNGAHSYQFSQRLIDEIKSVNKYIKTLI